MSDLRELDPLLVPAPSRLTRREGWRADHVADRRRDTRYAEEAYRLDVDEHGVLITALGEAGFARGEATLAQLRRQYGTRLPRLTIEDAPAWGERGYMLDVSRDRVPTNHFLVQLAERTAALKLNHLELYTEHTFAYRDHEEVWRAASPLTAADVRGLDALLASRSVRLAANQNCFGHLERWLRLPRYAPLAETLGCFVFEGIELQGPFSLCPTDGRSLPFVEGLLDELLENFSSRVVHVGCDETQDVGQGRSRAEVQAVGVFEVYRRHLDGVAAAARKRGFEPRFWADIALHFPDRLAELSADLVPVAWGYEPDHPFDAQAGALAASGRPFHLCCGTSAWRSFTGRTTERRANLAGCIAAAAVHGARGVQIAEWGDVGHRQVEPIGRLALAEFASRAWNPAAQPDPRAISLQVFGDESLRLADWLAELGDADRDLRAVSGVPEADGSPRRLTNATALFERLHPSGFPFRLPADPAPWHAALERLADLRAARPAVDAQLDAELDHALDQAELGARTGAGEPTGELPARVRAEHRRLWLAGSRPGGLEDSLAWWPRVDG
ncbi:glycoside hydrolase family 20 zincin-like fold domain-containing protein [Engelhardtia mirabilis]|uniref:Beta-hexosaminidase n=1 Tax=Engelhardtia mirabilis TaxID=2528011 RepID=A0A518BIN5_9BACT|nr:Beta-hexosaminidase [Planctomycetes bacterium Pla133]QDV01151.1 Beta-hexosaminidase [Planctomycetes bacterium Pla86]